MTGFGVECMIAAFMNQRILELPPHFEAPIEAELVRLGYSLKSPGRLAEAVLRMSDLYTQDALAPTPWREPWARAAQLAYYFPLNNARTRAVALEGQRLGFFEGIDSVTDFGSGAGAALFAFAEQLPNAKLFGIDSSQEALDLAEALRPQSYRKHERLLGRTTKPALTSRKSALLVSSFVLTELPDFPVDWHDFEALAIIEPSTQDDARRLMGERQRLIERGYQVWAPCTHMLACPLLVHSERDWCHDRVHWKAPSWFLDIEKQLPIKNRTLTFSYLLARRTKPPPQQLAQLARLTGDMLVEKGKTRQSVCRSPDREFLAWFPQRMEKSEIIELQRGSLVELVGPLEQKSNELRVKTPLAISERRADEKI
jgi:hypothetical protein